MKLSTTRSVITTSMWIFLGYLAATFSHFWWGSLSASRFTALALPTITLGIQLITLFHLTNQLLEMKEDRKSTRLIADMERKQTFLTNKLEFYSRLKGKIGVKEGHGDIKTIMEDPEIQSYYELYASDKLSQQLREYYKLYTKMYFDKTPDINIKYIEHFKIWRKQIDDDFSVLLKELRELTEFSFQP